MVARGGCETPPAGDLSSLCERTTICRRGGTHVLRVAALLLLYLPATGERLLNAPAACSFRVSVRAAPTRCRPPALSTHRRGRHVANTTRTATMDDVEVKVPGRRRRASDDEADEFHDADSDGPAASVRSSRGGDPQAQPEATHTAADGEESGGDGGDGDKADEGEDQKDGDEEEEEEEGACECLSARCRTVPCRTVCAVQAAWRNTAWARARAAGQTLRSMLHAGEKESPGVQASRMPMQTGGGGAPRPCGRQYRRYCAPPPPPPHRHHLRRPPPGHRRPWTAARCRRSRGC